MLVKKLVFDGTCLIKLRTKVNACGVCKNRFLCKQIKRFTYAPTCVEFKYDLKAVRNGEI